MIQEHSVAPDGGWGWVVLASTFISQFIAFGMARAFGVIYMAIPNTFHLSRAVAASIPMMAIAIMFFLSSFVGILHKHFSSRQLVITGSLLSTCAYLISAFATSPAVLLLGFGIIQGVAFAFLLLPLRLIVAEYFDRRRPLAFSISFAGGCVGGIVLPPLVEFLIEIYTLRGAMMIIAGLMLNITVFALLLRPLAVHHKKKATFEKNIAVNVTGTSGFPFDRTPSLQSKKREINHNEQSLDMIAKLETKSPNRNQEKFKQLKAFSKTETDSQQKASRFPVLIFLTITFSTLMQESCIGIFNVAIPDMSREVLVGQIQTQEASLLLSWQAGGDLVSRIFAGWFIQLKWFQEKHIYAFLLFAMGAIAQVIPYLPNYASFTAYSFIFGFLWGASAVIPTLLLTKYVESSQLATAYGLQLTALGIPNIALPPIIGTIRDSMGNYLLCYWLQTAAGVIGCALWLLESVYRRFWRRKTFSLNQIESQSVPKH